jgi:two-component system, response regulator YesN
MYMNLLLVDDDRISIDILRDFIKPHLERVDEVICAYDGTEAFDIIISVKPNIIVTDIKMHVLNGIELIKKVRALEHYHPFIMIISSYSDFEYARDALKLNVTDYILKPIDPDELIDKINACLKNESVKVSIDHEDIFEKVQKYLSENLRKPLRLKEIAHQFHYNAAYLGRLIKDKTGQFYSDYLLKLRVIKAQSLLVNTNQTIHKIASEVGFRDSEYFTKRFKRLTGYTPTEFRENNQNAV